jgi:RNA polymerase sigma-B factor
MVGEIKNYLRDHSTTVRVSRTVAELALKVKKAQARLTMELGAAPTVEQLAAELSESRERVLEAMESGLRSTNVALDTMEEDDYSAESWLGVEDSGYDRVEQQEVVKKLLSELDEQDRELLILRYFQGKTQAEAGRMLGLTQMYISRRERKLLGELRRTMQTRKTVIS